MRKLINPHIPKLRDLIHHQLDQAVIDFFFSSGGSGGGMARCTRWRPWSKCGDGVVEGNETCDDGTPQQAMAAIRRAREQHRSG